MTTILSKKRRRSRVFPRYKPAQMLPLLAVGVESQADLRAAQQSLDGFLVNSSHQVQRGARVA